MNLTMVKKIVVWIAKIVGPANQVFPWLNYGTVFGVKAIYRMMNGLEVETTKLLSMYKLCEIIHNRSNAMDDPESFLIATRLSDKLANQQTINWNNAIGLLTC